MSDSSNNGVSAHDNNLINVLFTSALDGEYVRDQITGTFNAYDPGSAKEAVFAGEHAMDEQTLAKLKEREHKAVKLAEKHGDIQGTIRELTLITEEYPHYASAYNNRAQAFRLEGKDDKALEDLDSAIKYAQDEATLGQAFTQKAIILRGKGDQDGAFYNFSQGAKYGNEVAKMAAAKENPYAKLCGKMVAEQMKQIRNPTLSSS